MLSVEQVARRYVERRGKLLDHRDCGVAAPAFNVAHIGPVDAGTIGKILLAPTLRLAKAAYIKTEARLDIHIDLKDAMSSIDLQTISHIRLDFARLGSVGPVTDCRQGGTAMTLIMIEEERARVVPRVPQGEARREAVLRDLIVAHPDILPVHDLDPSYGRLITITRELSIPGVGFVDVLLMDEHGRLVVVECKLWRNPQARREVVGQILDYARELSRFAYV